MRDVCKMKCLKKNIVQSVSCFASYKNNKDNYAHVITHLYTF